MAIFITQFGRCASNSIAAAIRKMGFKKGVIHNHIVSNRGVERMEGVFNSIDSSSFFIKQNQSTVRRGKRDLKILNKVGEGHKFITLIRDPIDWILSVSFYMSPVFVPLMDLENDIDGSVELLKEYFEKNVRYYLYGDIEINDDDKIFQYYINMYEEFFNIDLKQSSGIDIYREADIEEDGFFIYRGVGGTEVLVI